MTVTGSAVPSLCTLLSPVQDEVGRPRAHATVWSQSCAQRQAWCCPRGHTAEVTSSPWGDPGQGPGRVQRGGGPQTTNSGPPGEPYLRTCNDRPPDATFPLLYARDTCTVGEVPPGKPSRTADVPTRCAVIVPTGHPGLWGGLQKFLGQAWGVCVGVPPPLLQGLGGYSWRPPPPGPAAPCTGGWELGPGQAA